VLTPIVVSAAAAPAVQSAFDFAAELILVSKP